MNAPDWIPARSTATNRKPAATTARCTSSRRSAHSAGDLPDGQFDAGDVAVVAHAAVGEPERPQGPLRRLDLGELRRRHRLVVRDPRRQARCRRLVGAGQPEHPRDAPDGGLVEAGVGERPQHVVPGRRLRAGPVGPAHVVGVLAVGDPVEPVPVEHLGTDGREQFVLAVEAAVGPVGAVLGPVALAGLDLDDGYADEPGDVVRRGALVGGEAGRHPEQGDDLPRAQRADRQRQERRGVDPAGERHAQPADPGQRPGDPVDRGLVGTEADLRAHRPPVGPNRSPGQRQPPSLRHRRRRANAAALGVRSRVKTPFLFPPTRMIPGVVAKSAKFQTCSPTTASMRSNTRWFMAR